MGLSDLGSFIREIPFLTPILGAVPPDPNRGVTPPPEPRGIRGGGFRSPPPPTPPLPQTTKGFAPGPQVQLDLFDHCDLEDCRLPSELDLFVDPSLGSRGKALGRLGKGRCRRGRGSKPSPSDPPGFGGWGHPPVGVWGHSPQN